MKLCAWEGGDATGFYDCPQLKKLVTNKYKETILEKKDTTVYGLTAIFSKDTYASAACYRYESISKNILIGVSLEYFSKKYYKGAEDEL